MQSTNENSQPVGLRWLKVLVAVLTVTLIVGFLTIVILIALRFNSMGSPTLNPIPASIQIPSQAGVVGYTETPDWYLVVTEENEIFVFDRSNDKLIQTVIVQNQGLN